MLTAAGLATAIQNPATLEGYINYIFVAVKTAAPIAEEQLFAEISVQLTRLRTPQEVAAARKAMMRQANTLTKSLVKTQLQTLSDVIDRGVIEGLGPDAVARQLEIVKDLDPQRAKRLDRHRKILEAGGFSTAEVEARSEKYRQGLFRQRRQDIAQTEMRYVTSEANLDRAKARDQQFKMCISEQGPRVCPICQGNEAQGWIPIDDNFQSGQPYPPFHPRCRCTNAYQKRKPTEFDKKFADGISSKTASNTARASEITGNLSNRPTLKQRPKLKPTKPKKSAAEKLADLKAENKRNLKKLERLKESNRQKKEELQRLRRRARTRDSETSRRRGEAARIQEEIDAANRNVTAYERTVKRIESQE